MNTLQLIFHNYYLLTEQKGIMDGESSVKINDLQKCFDFVKLR